MRRRPSAQQNQSLLQNDVATQRGRQSRRHVRCSVVALKGPIAQLERALGMWLMDLHTTQQGYQEVTAPFVVGRSAL